MTNKESQFIEFKQNWRDEYLKVVASFANNKGGELIIGVDDKANAVGLKNDKLFFDKGLVQKRGNKKRNTLFSQACLMNAGYGGRLESEKGWL